MSRIRGVNLGEWLVLERWMDTSVFRGTDARDEDNLCRQLDDGAKAERFKEHRDGFIVEKDFEFIRRCGLDSVRLPIPHFVFGDDSSYCTPYVGCLEYVDRCFDWAQKYGLSVVLDMHTAPDSQNGYDNGGICAVCKWHQKPQNIARLIDVLAMLADRYGKRENFLGLELLNEPASEEVWQRNKRFYQAHDKERSKGSSTVPVEVLFDFYTRAYEEVRRHMPSDRFVILHDGFRLNLVKTFIRESGFKNVVLDTHPYLDMEGVTETTSTQNHLHRILFDWKNSIDECQKYVPIMIGEWSLPHNILPSLSPEQRYESYRLMSAAQLMTFEAAFAHYFWSYRVECYDKLGWDFRSCVERGWLPSDFRSVAEI